MSPDVRLVCVVAMLAGFSVLSVYVTVSSIYRIGRKDGEQRMRIERLTASVAMPQDRQGQY